MNLNESSLTTAQTNGGVSSLSNLTLADWRDQIEQQLPHHHHHHRRIAIVGSVDFYHADSPGLCDAIGVEIAQRIPDAVLLTGANAQTQQRVTRAFLEELQAKKQQAGESTTNRIRNPSETVFHLSPMGTSCDWGFGICFEAGRDAEERRMLLATMADVCISIEGGPGTADEMLKAHHAGKIVVPVIRTGGASKGMFGAMEAVVKPSFAEDRTWKLLMDDTATIEDSAKAVVSIVESSFLQKQEQAARPTLAGCAHLVFEASDFVSNHPDRGGSVPMGNIYLGPQRAASRLEPLQTAGISGIVNCTNTAPCYFRSDGIQYCVVAVNDLGSADILTYLDGATTFLHSLLTQNKNVLVHCQMGVSRSTTVVMAYLMRFQEMTRDEAYIHVRSRRPLASPNRGFWDQLQLFQEQYCDSKEEIVAASSSNHTPIDLDWAKKCNALFATCRDIPFDLEHNHLIECLLNVSTTPVARQNVLSVCLDFVWGRGVIDSDLDWLAFICQTLDGKREPAAETASALSTVKKIIQDKDSAFYNVWAGEIYEPQIKKVLEKLDNSRVSANAS